MNICMTVWGWPVGPTSRARSFSHSRELKSFSTIMNGGQLPFAAPAYAPSHVMGAVITDLFMGLSEVEGHDRISWVDNLSEGR